MTPQSAPATGHAESVGNFRGAVRATLWPTRSLVSSERWFDELYIWTEGGAATTTQRARIQIEAMSSAFKWLEYDLVETIGMTLSFGTMLTALYARSFALRAQDRAIRAEEQLRHYVMTGKLLDPRLNIRQIIALRFAGIEEFVALAQRAADQNLSPKDIKQAVKNWRTDNDRV